MGQDRESADFIFDLIYVDHPRVALFLSQFGRFGSLKGLTRSVTETHQKTVSGGIDATVHLNRETESSAEEELQRHFDPQWLLPLSLLDQLEDRQLICRDITKASLGQFVLCSGSLSILELSILKKIFELSGFRKSIIPAWEQANKAQQKGKATGSPLGQIKELGELVRQILTVVPYNLQATIAVESLEIWCGLKQDGMMIPDGEIFLKYGTSLPGTWSVLGLLDARPDEIAGKNATESSAAGPALVQMLAHFSPVLRAVIGRSPGAFGITPVVIFRKVVNGGVKGGQ